jgi:hypothetical protein
MINKQNKLNDFLQNFKQDNIGIYRDEALGGYWSNLSKEENSKIIEALKDDSPNNVVNKLMPSHKDVIFNMKRAVGLELLKLTGNEIAVDLGCMWGALSIPLSKQVNNLLAVDQTLESLIFSKERAKSENIQNIKFLRTNLREFKLPEKTFDIVLVNGVLEWVPEYSDVELGSYFHSKNKSNQRLPSPKLIQKEFLSKIFHSLETNGKLYLAIENRYDYSMFLGIPDPHSNMLFTSILPKSISNFLFKLLRKKEYRTWIYSFSETKKIVTDAGFKKIKMYSCWPDYRFPEQIFEYGKIGSNFNRPSIRREGKIKIRLLIKSIFETIIFKILKLDFFAPSIIIVAEK